LEIGTWLGATAAIVKTISPATEVITINHPVPEQVNNALEREKIGSAFRRRGLDVKLIWADSTDLLKLNLPLCDMIFVDGDHTREAALRDLANCWQQLLPEGYLLFHDFIPPGADERPNHTHYVVSAFRQFSRRFGREFEAAFHVQWSWIGVVQKRRNMTAKLRAAA
jgi:predicted O-methyltransferase YrrM